MSDDSASDQPPMTSAASPDREPDAPSTPAGPTCPWCSAVLDMPTPQRCPACGAGLVEDRDASIPGVTTLDPALLRVAQAVAAQPPKRGFFQARLDPVQETDAAGLGPASSDALAPPSRAVLEEMRRLRAELDEAAAAEAAAAAALLAAAGQTRAVKGDEPAATEAERTAAPAPVFPPGAHPGSEDPAGRA